eukprot:2213152-Amphidinium_carterae.1
MKIMNNTLVLYKTSGPIRSHRMRIGKAFYAGFSAIPHKRFHLVLYVVLKKTQNNAFWSMMFKTCIQPAAH